MQRRLRFILMTMMVYGMVNAQESSIIFSHNDYLQKSPFDNAYNIGVGYIEADVFLRDNKLMVAHTAIEIADNKTLEKLYLDPIKTKITSHGGTIYPDRDRTLTLMIDLKSEGIATLNEIVDHLNKYPEITNCKTLTVAISGNVPDTSQWKNYPPVITFDGRPNKVYSPKHLSRISFISDNFNNYSGWNGKKKISNGDLKKITDVIASVHHQNKKMRFWGTPDVPNCWEVFLQLGMEILGTDKVEELNEYLKTR